MVDVKIADVVVIGGGIRGLSIALSLAREGVRVVLVERRALAYMASSGTGAQVNVTAKEPGYYTAMALRSSHMYPDFIESLDADVFFQQEGILFVTTKPDEMDKYRQRVEIRNRVPGLHLQILDGQKAREIMPALSDAVIGGYISLADGLVDALQLVSAVSRAARRAGVVILRGTEVTTIEVTGGRIQKVITNNGTIATPVVINAAGVHAPHIGHMVGISIPVDPEHGQMVITQPYPRVLPLPLNSIRQWPSGSFHIGVTNHNIGYDQKVCPNWLPPFLQNALLVVPELKNVNVQRIFAHLRPMPPDRLPIYDQAKEVGGFYIAVGHSGFGLAPLTGKLFTDWIVHGEPDMDLSPYSLNRFDKGSKVGVK